MAQPQVATDDGTTSGGGFNRIPADEVVADEQQIDSDVQQDSSEESHTQPSAAEQQAESEASQHGWVSKEAWVADGKDASRWKPASEFLDVRRNVLNIVKTENQQLRAKVAAMEAKQAAKDRAEAAAQLRLTGDTLKEELRRATEDGDNARIAEVTQKLVEHGIEAKTSPVLKEPAKQPDPEVQQAFVEFIDRNSIFKTDKELAMDFMLELKRIAEVAPQLDMGEALAQAKRRVIRDNPSKFRSNGSRTAPMVETGGVGGDGGGTNGRTWNDLLPEVRRTAENDIRQKKYTKEDFLRECSSEHFRR